MIEVIASLYDTLGIRISSKKLQFAGEDAGRLTLTWAVRGSEGVGYSETVCRDLPVSDRSPSPTEGVSTKADWVA